MLRLLRATIAALLSGFRSRRELVVENLALRQQTGHVLQKRRPLIRPADRVFWVVLRRVWSRWSDAIVIVKPETVIGWHRAGFALLEVALQDEKCAWSTSGWPAGPRSRSEDGA